MHGHASLLFFGYTSCPDVCPATLAILREVQRQAPLAGLRFLFITVDPERDTPVVLKQYLGAFSTQFVGLYASRAALGPLMRSLAADAERQGPARWQLPADSLGDAVPARHARAPGGGVLSAIHGRDPERGLTHPGAGRRLMSDSTSASARLFVALQYLLPQLLLSRLVGRLARARADWIRKPLIRAFVRAYRPELADAAQPDPLGYESFNAFFTRALRPGARSARAARPPRSSVQSTAGSAHWARRPRAEFSRPRAASTRCRRCWRAIRNWPRDWWAGRS